MSSFLSRFFPRSLSRSRSRSLSRIGVVDRVMVRGIVGCYRCEMGRSAVKYIYFEREQTR